jgi:hypothetical protein
LGARAVSASSIDGARALLVRLVVGGADLDAVGAGPAVRGTDLDAFFARLVVVGDASYRRLVPLARSWGNLSTQLHYIDQI